MRLHDIREASPNTLAGSFTPDLVLSKTWLCHTLKTILDGRSANRVYILGSWYGNMAIFLQQSGIEFDEIVFVEPDRDSLDTSRELLEPLYREGRLVLLNVPAESVMYEHDCTVINTSCNETGAKWLENVPLGVLVALQARNNVHDVVVNTDDRNSFNDQFPISKTLFLGQKRLQDPETAYLRFMKIGRR